MSLLGEIRGSCPPTADPAATLLRLGAALLAENRLPPAAVVAARIRIPEGAELPLAAPRELGWRRIPVFWERVPPGAALEVVAHVRLKRRRRLREVQLDASLEERS